MYDLNQKTMQALDRLAGVCATFEDTWGNVENETAVGNILFAESYEAQDELAKAQPNQARFQDELKNSQASVDSLSGSSAPVGLSTKRRVSTWRLRAREPLN